MTKIPDEAVTADVEAVDEGVNWVAGLFGEKYDNAEEVMTDDLTAALPFLTAGLKVKPLEWVTVTCGQLMARTDLVVYIVDNDPGCGSPAWYPCDKDEDWHPAETLEAAKSAAQADYEQRIMSAIVSAPHPRRAALEALRSAEQFIENGFEFGFIRKPDEGDSALETLPKIKAAIRDLQSTTTDARPSGLDEGFRKGLEAACEVIDKHSEYDRQMCCDGRECGCYGATVHQSMQHYIRALAAEPATDDGIERGKFYHKHWPTGKLLEARRGGLVDHSGGEAWRYEYTHKDDNGEYDVLYRPVKNSTIPAYFPVSSVAKGGGE